jgi:hypothetical protein
MRFQARRKPSGVVHYYYDHGGKPRREEPLGPDYGLAIQKWADYERSRYAKEKLAERSSPSGTWPTATAQW